MPVINVPGVASGALKLDGPTLAEHLPRQDHDVERPGDRRAQWRRDVAGEEDHGRASFGRFGHDLQLRQLPVQGQRRSGRPRSAKARRCKWPTGIGGKGNEGVAAYVKQINGGIGYVELSYALQNKMAYAAHEERGRQLRAAVRRELSPPRRPVPTGRSAKDFYLVMTNAPGENAWPITATNFILMYKQPKNAGRRKAGEGVLHLGRMPKATRRPRRWTTCRCRTRWSSRSKRTGRRT